MHARSVGSVGEACYAWMKCSEQARVGDLLEEHVIFQNSPIQPVSPLFKNAEGNVCLQLVVQLAVRKEKSCGEDTTMSVVK